MIGGQTLLSGEQTVAARWSVHVELTTQSGRAVTHTVRSPLGDELATQSGSARDARVEMSVPGATLEADSLTHPQLGALGPGEAATVSLAGVMPPVAAKAPAEVDSAYIARLGRADREGLDATATTTATATGAATRSTDGTIAVGTDRDITAPTSRTRLRLRLPVLSLVTTGPEAAFAGGAVTFKHALVNDGSEPALVAALDHRFDDGLEPVVGAPDTVAPDSTGFAEVTVTIPPDQPDGRVRDDALVTWEDAAGNVYGPVSDFWAIDVVTPRVVTAPELDQTATTPLADATRFLYEGADPMQTGVVSGTIELERAAVLRGKVASADGQPLVGVSVSVVGRPQFGQTTTGPDGEFYMAVNGGEALTVRLEKPGYLPVDRRVEVPWNDYAFIDDVVMIALDGQVTEIDLGGPLSPGQVAQGSPVSDMDGARQATLLFAPGTEATMTMSVARRSRSTHCTCAPRNTRLARRARMRCRRRCRRPADTRMQLSSASTRRSPPVRPR